VIRTPLARVAADHLPLLVEFDVVAQRSQVEYPARALDAQPSGITP
jgi:hypothetical protein